MAKAKTLLKVALRGTLALQSSMATLFSSLEKGLLVFPHIAEIDWQMRSRFGSCIILVIKTVIQRLEWQNLVWNIPRHRKTKCNCPQGPSSKGKARGNEYVLVMFYCGDCKYCIDKITKALRSTKKKHK